MHLPLVESGDSRLRQRRQAVEAIPVASVGSLPGERAGGLVAVEGTVEPHERTASAPLTGDDVVVAAYERHRPIAGDRYEVVERRVEAVPFFVADGTGRALVDPGWADGGTDPGEREGGDTAGRPEGLDPFAISPGNTRWFVGDEAGESVRPVPDPDAIAPERSEWVHRVATIRPGEDVYVLGEATEGGEGVRIRPAAEAFVVSDLARAALLEALRRASPDVSRQFLRFAVLGVIAVAVVIAVIVILVVTLAP